MMITPTDWADAIDKAGRLGAGERRRLNCSIDVLYALTSGFRAESRTRSMLSLSGAYARRFGNQVLTDNDNFKGSTTSRASYMSGRIRQLQEAL